MRIEFLDGSIKEYKDGLSALDMRKVFLAVLLKSSYAIVHAKIWFNKPIEKWCYFEIVTKEDVRFVWILRHSASHLLASAVKIL